eukprot:m.486449 g.486449  ORF g.486449 m.486449 type:complete len:52 (-) comp24405_c0_seq1:181-336(-)
MLPHTVVQGPKPPASLNRSTNWLACRVAKTLLRLFVVSLVSTLKQARKQLR